MPSIAACCNVYNEANAISGWIESASQWADHITVFHTGPGGALSTDGTVEICEKWGVEQKFGSIDAGFGVVRSQMVTMCPTDWVWIGDADERIHRFAPRLVCFGTERYPEVTDPDLHVQVTGVYDQVEYLRSLLAHQEYDAIVTSRRHWGRAGFHWDRPAQNWFEHPDWQARILRCASHIGYRADIAMHEQLVDYRTGQTPRWYQPTVENCEVYFDHYHLWFKAMEAEQRLHDIQIYDAIHAGRKPPSLEEFRFPHGITEATGDAA